MNLNKRRRGKKCLPTRFPEPLTVPVAMNQSWSIDFMSDRVFCGRRFRNFIVVDDFIREVHVTLVVILTNVAWLLPMFYLALLFKY